MHQAFILKLFRYVVETDLKGLMEKYGPVHAQILALHKFVVKDMF